MHEPGYQDVQRRRLFEVSLFLLDVAAARSPLRRGLSAVLAVGLLTGTEVSMQKSVGLAGGALIV